MWPFNKKEEVETEICHKCRHIFQKSHGKEVLLGGYYMLLNAHVWYCPEHFPPYDQEYEDMDEKGTIAKRYYKKSPKEWVECDVEGNLLTLKK